MLKAFSVRNYRDRQDLSIDLSVSRDYAFSTECISRHGGIVKTGLVFGANGSGKSSLFTAIHDLAILLAPAKAESVDGAKPATGRFAHVLTFEADEVTFEYERRNGRLIHEELTVNGRLMYRIAEGRAELDGLRAFHPNLKLPDVPSDGRPFLLTLSESSDWARRTHAGKVVRYAEGMTLWTASDRTCGPVDLSPAGAARFVREQNLEEKFFAFLTSLGVGFECDGMESFIETASSGMKRMLSCFVLTSNLSRATLILADDFDVNLALGVPEAIFQRLRRNGVQCLMSSHRTSLLTHFLVRPDVCFKVRKGRATCFSDLTDREIRYGNNLEKLYLSGEFDV